MNFIKKSRTSLGYTQQSLAAASGLSLRTIQRVESGSSDLKGHTLMMLSKVFGIKPIELQRKSSINPKDISTIHKINLYTLAFFLFPLGNVILPYFIWKKYRNSELVDLIGRKIISVQILWTLALYLSLCVSPFLSTSFPLILMALFAALGINTMILLRNSYKIHHCQIDKIQSPITFI